MTTPRSRLVRAHDAAAVFYRRELHGVSAESPRDYLRRRGFAFLVTSEVWTIGYAPPGWTALTGHLRGEGFTDQELLDAGLVLTTRLGTIIDRFRDRLTFGIRDAQGDLVGFTGRAAPGVGPDCPKYLTSPRTPIFEKRLLLFGLAEQADLLASGQVPVLTEGPLDATAFTPTDHVGVAVCGAALTDGQSGELSRASRSKRAVVSFDADSAGLHAGATAYPRLASHFDEVDTLTLSDRSDPAALFQRGGAAALQDALKRTLPLADHLVDATVRRFTGPVDSAEARVAALRASARIVVLQPDRIAEQATRLGRVLDLDIESVTRELAAAVAREPDRADTTTRRRVLVDSQDQGNRQLPTNMPRLAVQRAR